MPESSTSQLYYATRDIRMGRKSSLTQLSDVGEAVLQLIVVKKADRSI